METKTTDIISMERLAKCGFTQAAKQLEAKKAKAKKLMIAYEHYRYIRPENIQVFNEKLKADTLQGTLPYNVRWKTLDFVPIAAYQGIPPGEVLEALEVAQERKCFDAFEVVTIREVHDPLLLGVIEGCLDKFFISQWDSDISITDLLKENEG